MDDAPSDFQFDETLAHCRASRPGFRAARTGPRRVGPPRDALGEWLVQRRVLTRHQLFLALSTSHRLACRLGEAAVVLDFVNPNTLENEAQLFDLVRRVEPEPYPVADRSLTLTRMLPQNAQQQTNRCHRG